MGTRDWKVDAPMLIPPRLSEWIGTRTNFIDFLVEFVTELAEGDEALQPTTNRLGAPRFDRRMLLLVWLYGLTVGITSCRKLEEACKFRTDFIYLTGRQAPDHTTLWYFFNDYRSELKPTFKRLLQILKRIGVVRGDVALIDGTTVASAGSRHQIRDTREAEQKLARLEKEFCERVDEVTEGEEEIVSELPAETDKKELREQIRLALDADEPQGAVLCETEAEDPSESNARDPDDGN